ncbi:hypothetical protein PoB_003996200 [Plakobranchus ocellatus]|uniref:Uncharacterized protein n=1 Tax=Plakobranchus ocellatus TaxID=259542 RepID=A0AAV4B2W5_9GAST|nr:hypothetical protein PoB_003996200 [Plakobranchus ocellatus]
MLGQISTATASPTSNYTESLCSNVPELRTHLYIQKVVLFRAINKKLFVLPQVKLVHHRFTERIELTLLNSSRSCPPPPPNKCPPLCLHGPRETWSLGGML